VDLGSVSSNVHGFELGGSLCDSMVGPCYFKTDRRVPGQHVIFLSKGQGAHPTPGPWLGPQLPPPRTEPILRKRHNRDGLGIHNPPNPRQVHRKDLGLFINRVLTYRPTHITRDNPTRGHSYPPPGA